MTVIPADLMPATGIGFIDTETTKVGYRRRCWETALILHAPGRPRTEYEWVVQVDDLDLANADPTALNIGKFYERHPQMAYTNLAAPSDVKMLVRKEQSEHDVLEHLESVTRRVHLWGINPAFDIEGLGARMHVHGMLPNWHYRSGSNCVKTMLRGYLLAQGKRLAPEIKTEEMFRMIGIDTDGFAYHTALGDARLAEYVWFTLNGLPQPLYPA